jgi:tRNA (cytidine/uridine-2'-O-)-methyltransferase
MKSHSIKMVLFSPQIPPNTGSIARSCAALNAQLHLIKPLGFSISDKAVRRAGLDYWKDVDLVLHETFEDFKLFKEKNPGRLIAFSPSGQVSFKEFSFQKDDWIMHGREDDGIPAEVLLRCDKVLTIPMFNQKIRSLNLAVSAAISLFEAVLQVSG